MTATAYEVSEHENPGTLEFSFTAGAGENEGTVYYLRTEAMGYSEQLGLLCEQYHNENASQVKTGRRRLYRDHRTVRDRGRRPRPPWRR